MIAAARRGVAALLMLMLDALIIDVSILHLRYSIAFDIDSHALDTASLLCRYASFVALLIRDIITLLLRCC